MMTLGRVWLAVAAACLASAAFSGTTTHTVQPGESASAIAKHYYGTFDPAELLLTYNGKTSNVLRAGETLSVPYSEVHRVQPGDTLSVIAERYLGRSSVYPVVALMNDLGAEHSLSVGQELVIPVAVPYRLGAGDTLSTLADRFYGNARFTAPLQLHNGIEDPRRLSVGQEIEIPLTNLRLVAQPAVPRPTFEGEIRQARLAFERGEYARARELIAALGPRVDAKATKAERIDLLRLQSYLYVAFDLRDAACESYRSLIDLAPSYRMDPDLVSPKIRTTFEECPGTGSDP
jgi:LysM repeat protein